MEEAVRKKPSYNELEQRISELEQKLSEKTGKHSLPVEVPAHLRSAFEKAHEYVGSYFRDKIENISQGAIYVSGERYVLLRAASVSKEFFDLIQFLYRDRGKDEAREVAQNFLYDFAHAIGKEDAKSFHKKMGVSDPLSKFSAGPIHFAYTGWAVVRVLPESNPVPGPDFTLFYEHPFAFEADSWMKQGGKTDFPVCIMSAGYSSGWCEESFQIPLAAVELECRSSGDAECRFLMAPPERIEKLLKDYEFKSGNRISLSVPEFFQRKRLEEELKRSEEELNTHRLRLEELVAERTSELTLANERLRREIVQRSKAKEDQVRMEEALRKREWFWGAVFNAIQDGVSVLDPELSILSVNQTMTKWFKRNLPLDGKKCFRVFQGLEKPCDPCPALRALRTGKLEMNERPLKTRGAVVGTLELFAFPMFDEDGRITGVVEFARDVTIRKKADEDRDKMRSRLQEAQKMQAIATLAGGIAHQFNNALASISLSIDLIRMDLPQENSLHGYVRKMKASTERMAHLTSQLLAYAEGGRYQTRVVSMHEFIREAVHSVVHDLDPSIQVETDLPPDTMCVRADVTQLQMVVSAVLHNAAEAMWGGGRIRVSIRNEVLGEKCENLPQNFPPGPYVCLTVEDNGRGMDEETRKRMFEPFFTTKFQGRGLGMPAVYGIIKGHDGCVVVNSVPGEGTCVKIYLPGLVPQESGLEVREADALRGGGTVLLVEDEEMIMEVSRALLERIGYRVLEARTGNAAVQIASNAEEKIDLAILDVILPDMGGKEIYQKLLEKRPDLKVLVCSGFSADGPAHDILKAGAQGFIQKPFSLVDLNRKLREILGPGWEKAPE